MQLEMNTTNGTAKLKDSIPPVPQFMESSYHIDAIQLSFSKRFIDRPKLYSFISHHPNFSINTKDQFRDFILIHGEILIGVNSVAQFLRDFMAILLYEKIFILGEINSAIIIASGNFDLIFNFVGISRIEFAFDLKPQEIALDEEILDLLEYFSLYSSDYKNNSQRSMLCLYSLILKYYKKNQVPHDFIESLKRSLRLEFRLIAKNCQYLCIENLEGSQEQIFQRFLPFLQKKWWDLNLSDHIFFNDLSEIDFLDSVVNSYFGEISISPFDTFDEEGFSRIFQFPKYLKPKINMTTRNQWKQSIKDTLSSSRLKYKEDNNIKESIYSFMNT